MIAGPQQKSPAFDPVAAGAALRRSKVQELRTRSKITTTVQKKSPPRQRTREAALQGEVNATTSTEFAVDGADRQEPTEAVTGPKNIAPSGDQKTGAPTPDGGSAGHGEPQEPQGAPSAESGPNRPAQRTPAGNRAEATPNAPAAPGAPANGNIGPRPAPPLEGNRQANPEPSPEKNDDDKFPTVRPGESLDDAKKRHAAESGKTLKRGESTDDAQKRLNGKKISDDAAEKLKKNAYSPSPPLRLPSQNSPDSSGRSQEQESADRQLDAANGTNDYAAQARARGAAQRAATKAKKASQAGEEDGGMKQQAVGWVYSLLFQGGGAIDELGETGGIVASVAESGNLYQTILTVFPGFNDKMNESSMGQWLPQKFDVLNTRKQEMLFHFGEFCKGLAAATEMLLYILLALLLPILLGVAFTFFTHPILGVRVLFSAF